MNSTALWRFNTADQSDEVASRHTSYDVIDGQQRLTTLLILINKIAEKFAEHDREGTQYVRSQYIENEGFKLTLKGDDDQFFKKEILGGRDGFQQSNRSPKRGSQENLVNADRFFEDQLEQKESELSVSEFEAYLEELYSTIKGLQFMAYKVQSPSEAVRIFETTNDRGKDLTKIERTKSFLMYQLHLCYEEGDPELEEHLDDMRYAFNDMYEYRKEADANGSVPGLDRIQRYHFVLWDDESINVNSPPYTNHLSSIKERFRDMENDGEKVQEIVEYVEELRECFENLKQIKMGDIEDETIAEQVDQFFALGAEANFYPLLFAAWSKFKSDDIGAEDLSALLTHIETYTFRVYAICQDYRTNKRKRHFYNRGRELRDGDRSVAEVIEKVGGYIDTDCDDEKLRDVLSERDIYKNLGTQRLRYLLYFYDVSLSKRDEHLHLNFDEAVTQEFENQEISIEHIWPQDPDKLDLSEAERERYHDHKHRLGNLALMIGAENSGQSNKPFERKRDWYEDSRIHMLNEVADPEMRAEWGDPDWDDDVWGIEQIDEREGEIIDFVIERWPNYGVTV